MTTGTDFYQLLGVSREASEVEIKKAYRKLAMQYHPDRNNGDPQAEARFKEITEAYEVLRDPNKRARYDRFGPEGLRGGAGAGGFGGFHHVDLAEALEIFMRDFGGFGGFDAVFGGGRRARRAQRRGQDVRVTIKLSLEEIAHGATKTLRLKSLVPCERCRGTGSRGGSQPTVCATCAGRGEVQRATQSVFGQFVSVTPCPTCHGEGSVVTDPCDACRGDGRQRQERSVEVEVPAGVTANHYVTLRGKGAAGPRGGPAGDLLVEFAIEDDPRFERHGDDLVYDLPISFSQAGLGATFTVPTPYGDEAVSVPAGTQSGSIITLRGKGIPGLADGRRGNLHVRIQVWTPTELTPELKRALEALADLEGEPPGDESLGRRFWDRMKRAFGA